MTRQTRGEPILPEVEALEDRCVPSLTPVMVNGVRCVFDSDAVDVTADATPGATGVTWLADANFAASKEGQALACQYGVTGINPDGSMTFGTAVHWVDALNKANYAGHCNWSLPGTLRGQIDQGYLPNDPNVLTGPPDNDNHEKNSFGYDLAGSPMGHLFYREFGGVLGDTLSTVPNQANVALFKDFQPYYYWSGTEEPSRSLPADFSFGSGFLGTDKSIDFEYVIPEFSSGPSDITAKLLRDFPSVDDLVVTPPPVPAPSGPLTVNPDGTIHDATLNINWLADANFATTNTFGISHVRLDPDTHPGLDLSSININPDGSMNHDTAVELIRRMNSFDNGPGKPKGYLFHTNWRLPDSQDLAVQGYYKTTGAMASSEMGELFYTELGGQAGSTIGLTHERSLKLFQNLQPYYYWSGSPTNGDGVATDGRESFSFGTGYRSDNTTFNFMYVLPVYDSPGVVTSSLDDGTDDIKGSLRQVIDGAHGGDTIVFSPSLAGQTIALRSQIKIAQDDEFENKVLDIEGPGAGRLAVSGGNVDRIFRIAPFFVENAIAGRSVTVIGGLTFENGRSGQGGAILDEGNSLILAGDIFSWDQAVGAPGSDGVGGGVAVQGKSTPDLNVLLIDCQFSNDAALGGAGGVGESGSESNGGNGKGGALYVDAGSAAGLSLLVLHSRFTDDSALGGAGVNADASAGLAATDGGNGLGGAVFLATEATGAASAALFAACTFSDCSAIGGSGGKGSAALPGGQSGVGYGGGLFIEAGITAYGFLVSFCDNHAEFGPDYYGILRPLRL
jgi:hypothetical protein